MRGAHRVPLQQPQQPRQQRRHAMLVHRLELQLRGVSGRGGGGGAQSLLTSTWSKMRRNAAPSPASCSAGAPDAALRLYRLPPPADRPVPSLDRRISGSQVHRNRPQKICAMFMLVIAASVFGDCGCTADESCCQDSKGYACCIDQTTYCVKPTDGSKAYPVLPATPTPPTPRLTAPQARCCPQWTVGCSVGSVGCCDPVRTLSPPPRFALLCPETKRRTFLKLIT